MEYGPKKILLKNHIPCLLRTPTPHDAALLIKHMRITAWETDFISMYPDEITPSIRQEQQYLQKTLLSKKSLIISAFVNKKLAGNACIYPVSSYNRYHHRATFGISVCKEYWRLGIGSHLLSEIIQCSREMGYEQLELEVVCENERGLVLYDKFGFESYGRREHSFKYRDESYADMYLMMLKL